MALRLLSIQRCVSAHRQMRLDECFTFILLVQLVELFDCRRKITVNRSTWPIARSIFKHRLVFRRLAIFSNVRACSKSSFARAMIPLR